MASFVEFQNFNAELAALIRAGVPLESGLTALERSSGSGLAALSHRVQDRLNQGRTLIESLRQEEGHFSETYLATVEAALRADELPAALDSLTAFGRATEDVRQQIRIALIYPKIVVVMAYLLFATFLRVALGHWFELMQEFGYTPKGFLGVIHTIWQWPDYVFFLAPIVIYVALRVLIGFYSRWAAGGHSGGLSTGELTRRGFWLPGVKSIYDDLAASQVSSLLSLLLRHNVPLVEALTLVSRAATSGRFSHGLASMAQAVQAGQDLTETVARAELPWLLRETLLTLGRSPQLAEGLQQSAAVYQRRALRRAENMQRYTPVVLTVLVGGSIVLVYALTVIIPLKTLFGELMSNWS
jgi:type II secretory pathway component PulF